MAATFYTLLTKLGQAAIANATALNTPVNLTKMAVGDGGGAATVPKETQTALIGEKYRANLNSLTIDSSNPNYIIAEMIIPTTTGGWSVREVGVFDSAGNLFAIANFPETYKPQLAEGSGRDLVIRIVIQVSNASVVTLQVDPAVTLASQSWVADNFVAKSKVSGGTAGQVLMKNTDENQDYTWKTLASATVENKGIVQLSDATNSTSKSLAATANAVKLAFDEAGKKALIAGSELQTFLVANATNDKMAVNRGQLTEMTPGRLLNVQVFYNSGIYNPTPGTKKVIVEMVGGGGGSAGSRSASSGQISVGGAGGAGSYAKGQFTQNFSGVQITVGTKGAGGTSSGPYASDGGTSSFGSLITAAGGSAGQPAGPTNSFPFSTVAAVVSAGTNGANIIGTPGQGASASIAVSAAVVIESPGGSSQFGAGGFITAFNAKGVNGSGYGSGGGPSKVNGGSAAVAGGDGSQGLVIVWEYA